MSITVTGELHPYTVEMFDSFYDWMMIRKSHMRWSEKQFIEQILKISTCAFYKKRKKLKDKVDYLPAYLQHRYDIGKPITKEDFLFAFEKIA